MNTVGIDIIEIDRVASVVDRWGNRFLNRIYTKNELDYCRGRFPQLAARFAAKEAVMKALGTGVRGISWKDIEVVRYIGRAPIIRLHDRAKAKADSLGITVLSVSLSHSQEFAIAFVVAESAQPNY